MSTFLAAVMLAALTLYSLLAGADFGGGLWDLTASKKQRELITHAMAPVWEANHVWLILLVVVLFTAFPPAFAAILTALHTPLTLALAGIVFRGSAFVFRQYGGAGRSPERGPPPPGSDGDDRAEQAWGRVFAVASIVTPLCLGAALGALTTGGSWLSPFSLALGAFSLALFAMLAAVYLTVEAEDAKLQSDFRLRAIAAAVASAVLALITALLAPAPVVPLPAAVVSLAIGAALLAALLLRRFPLARVAAVALVTLVVTAWGYERYPVLLPPGLTVQSAAAPEGTLTLLAPTLAVGAFILFPSLYWMLRVFKRRAG